MKMPIASPQSKARLAGLSYMVTIAAGLFAEIGARSAFRGEHALATKAVGLPIGYPFPVAESFLSK